MFRRPHKYRAKKTTVDGFTFDSKSESERWVELQILLRNGQISDLERQRSFDLHGRDGSVVCRYVLDYCYTEDGKKIAEDRKGFKTATYRLKRKMFIAEYGNTWEHRES